MNNKEKLIELLKKNSEVKNAMEQLEFGCRIKLKNINGNLDNKSLKETPIIVSIEDGLMFTSTGTWSLEYLGKIIGLPISERFIIMYCKNKDMIFEITQKITTLKFYIYLNEIDILFDYTKDFDNQSEETFGKIFEALNNL